MQLTPYSLRDLQTAAAVVSEATVANLDLSALSVAIAAELAARSIDLPVSSPRQAASRRPDNVTVCQACGKPAVIVPLSPSDRSATVTHAIQCQNRPVIDQPWRSGMCGHTDYIYIAEKSR